MDINSSYQRSTHWAGDDMDLDLVAERVRLAYEQLAEREAHPARRRTVRLGFLRRARHA
jgi:hypothetical protein